MQKKYRDWDCIEDLQGHHYRVVGNFHSQNNLYVQWHSPEFSVEKPSFPSSQFFESVNFSLPPILKMPFSKIHTVKSPLEKFQALLAIVEHGSFAQRQQLTVEEREKIEAGLAISHKYQVEIKDMGVTDNSIFHGPHPKTSEIHLIVYGNTNAKKIVSAPFRLPAEGTGLRSLMKIEILPEAERIAIYTGQPMEDCFHMLYYRYDHFFLRNRPIRLSFVPSLIDMDKPGSCHNITDASVTPKSLTVKITATISDDTWGCFYPYSYEIVDVKILKVIKLSEGILPPDVSSIVRLLILDDGISGYYRTGDHIEAIGSLQLCEKMFHSTASSQKPIYQVFLGGHESYEGEYVSRQAGSEV